MPRPIVGVSRYEVMSGVMLMSLLLVTVVAGVATFKAASKPETEQRRVPEEEGFVSSRSAK